MPPSAENPLNRPDLFQRITQQPKHYLIKKLIDEKAAHGVPLDQLALADAQSDAIEESAPEFSLMAKDEADALLTEEGAVWFISQATGLDDFEASRLLLAGMPWPLRSIEDDKAWSAGPFDFEQVAFLCGLFQPIKLLDVVLYDLSLECWVPPKLHEKDGPVYQARAYWEYVAGETGSDVESVKRVAIALHLYHCCLQNFARQFNHF